MLRWTTYTNHTLLWYLPSLKHYPRENDIFIPSERLKACSYTYIPVNYSGIDFKGCHYGIVDVVFVPSEVSSSSHHTSTIMMECCSTEAFSQEHRSTFHIVGYKGKNGIINIMLVFSRVVKSLNSIHLRFIF